jgi:hypothetical protein
VNARSRHGVRGGFCVKATYARPCHTPSEPSSSRPGALHDLSNLAAPHRWVCLVTGPMAIARPGAERAHQTPGAKGGRIAIPITICKAWPCRSAPYTRRRVR